MCSLKLGLIIVAIVSFVVIFPSCVAASYLQYKKKKKAPKRTSPAPYSLTQSWNTGSGQLGSGDWGHEMSLVSSSGLGLMTEIIDLATG